MVKQKVPESIWNEFEAEQERIKNFDISKLQLTSESNKVLDTFFKKFLDPAENFPEGSRHATIEKNFAVYIIKNKIPTEQIKAAYKAKKFNFQSLKSQINGVLEGTYGEEPNVSVGELVNWCKKNRPDLVEMFKNSKKSSDLKTFIFDENEVIQERVFTSHLLDGNSFGFGILLPRMEDLFSKNNKKVGEHQVWRPVVITSDKRGHAVSQWMMNEYKIRYSEIPYEMKLRWTLKDVDNYLHKETPIVSGKELFQEIKKQYEYYLFYRGKEWYSVNTLWDIGTYFHQLFSAFPLKEERGLSGTAKTKTMVVSSYVTLNGTDIMTNPSEATLFRETENLRPTKYIDEAEKLFRWTKEGLEPDNRVELINASYIRNGSVPRQERCGSKYTTKWYHVYSPTRISSINGLYGATESRAITQIHTKAPDNDVRGERDPEDDCNDIKWKNIRNKCYLFVLQNWEAIYDSYLNFDIKTKLKKRDLQLWKPLLVIAKSIDENNLLPEIIGFAEKISAQRKMDYLSEATLDYKLLDCLNHLIKIDDSGKVYVNDIRVRYNEIYKKSEPTNAGYCKTISTHLDKLGFKDLRSKDMRGSYFEITKPVFDEIISPITADFSSEPSYSSDLHINKVNNNDECMMNNDEYNNKENSNYDEYDETDAYDDRGSKEQNAKNN